jgi:hypothetical protein
MTPTKAIPAPARVGVDRVRLGASAILRPVDREGPRRPVSELTVGLRVRGTVASHQPWGVIVELDEFEPVGASVDVIRRQREPGIAALVDDMPGVGATLYFVVEEIRLRGHEPRVWIDLTVWST